jgi:hypothetical protein
MLKLLMTLLNTKSDFLHTDKGKTAYTHNIWLTFLWLTSFMSLNSRYARLACVTFWNGRLSFLIATFCCVIVSYAALQQIWRELHDFKGSKTHSLTYIQPELSQLQWMRKKLMTAYDVTHVFLLTYRPSQEVRASPVRPLFAIGSYFLDAPRI